VAAERLVLLDQTIEHLMAERQRLIDLLNRLEDLVRRCHQLNSE
jgi:hypothetical protein